MLIDEVQRGGNDVVLAVKSPSTDDRRPLITEVVVVSSCSRVDPFPVGAAAVRVACRSR